MTGAALVLCLLPAAPADTPPGRLDLEPGDLRPGLVADYRSRSAPTATLTRVDPKPAFYLGPSSPHPSLPPGPFEVTWSGVITLKDPGPISFSALVGGELSITVDGTTVLDGRGPTDISLVTAKAALKREPGSYRLTVRYRSLADVPARLQLWWEGPTFAREPVPAWRLGHLVTDRTPALERADLAAAGRAAVERRGCARCHQGAFPGVPDTQPGPSIADGGRRPDKRWLLNWLADPAKVRTDAHMPALFTPDRAGFVDRWIVAEHLGGTGTRADEAAPGDHRKGQIAFLSLGCVACHFVPDIDRAGQKDLGRIPLTGLGDRLPAGDLAAFLADPHARYPDGRMPKLPLTPAETRDLAAYLLLWSKPSADLPAAEAPTAEELRDAYRRLGVTDRAAAAAALVRDKGCTACHPGLGESRARDLPLRATDDRGCLGGKTGARYSLPAETHQSIAAYLTTAGTEKHPSPFAVRQQKLARAGCVRCHQRDGDRQPPLEEVGSTIGGAFLQELPFLRTPRLTNPHQKFRREYLGTAVREGVTGVRWGRFSFRMPAFGPAADDLVRALAEADGELPAEPDAPVRIPADPTLGTVHGPQLVGFQGYGCASCHVWGGKLLGSPDPGATGPDLTRTADRLRREWFDRYLESPMRLYPGTPMPSIFEHGKPASLGTILDGDPAKQKDALWAYLARGKDAPSPAPPPPLPIPAPAKGEAAIVAQIPIRLPDGRVVESLALFTADNDLLVYDLGAGGPHTFYTGGQILRNVQGRVRQFLAAGTPTELAATPTLQLLGRGAPELPVERALLGYDRLADGVLVRWQLRFGADVVDVRETLRLGADPTGRRFSRELHLAGLPKGARVEFRNRAPESWKARVTASAGELRTSSAGQVTVAEVTPGAERTATATVRYDLPAARPAPAWDGKPITFADAAEGALVRPGYRAIAYPRPKTISGEDRIMPAAVAVRPRDGQVFVASLKTGELFALRDPTGDGRAARFEDFGRGLYQDALSMLAEDDGLYVLHRRNLTKIAYPDHSGPADRFDRVLALPHGVADTYDMAYGLVHDRQGRFTLSYAPYANTTMPGSGGVLRVRPGQKPEEVAFGLRNPLGWCAGPGGESFFTDNQGDWVAANKLCHVDEGRFYGWPNRAQKQHATKPAGKPAVWVPYSWARSINGVAYDNTGGKFGPFAGQFFMAELMFGGAIIRADVERVNGMYQGACFPFWGKGLLGPVSLAFDPRGRMYVGGITEPGWMAQPDRGALFGIDFTGKRPFEMRSIRVRPDGFRVVFTTPVDRATAGNPASYRLEHYRYEYTGAYGSPELDRTAAKVDRVRVAADGLSAELVTAPLVKDRVYTITAAGVRSAAGEELVHPTGAYTLNEVPAE